MRSEHSNIFQSFHCVTFIIRQSDSLKKTASCRSAKYKWEVKNLTLPAS